VAVSRARVQHSSATRAEELPCPDLELKVLMTSADVTVRVLGAVDSAAAVAASMPVPDDRTPAVPDDETGDRVMPPCRADRTFERIAEQLNRQMPARFRAVRFECLDAVGHYYLRYTMPAAFGDVSDEEFEKFFSDPYQVACGTYSNILRNWSQALQPGNLFIGRFEEIAADPGGLLRRLLAFLGVADDLKYVEEYLHVRVNPTEDADLPDRHREFLQRLFSEEVRGLSVGPLTG
jgi:hypothetical protein